MFKIAFRNVLRNKRRTLLSLGVIALGTAALFLVKGYTAASYLGLKYMAVGQYGHLQIADRNYWKKGSESSKHLISGERFLQIKGMLAKEGWISSFTSTLNFSGLIGTAEKSAIFIGGGVEPGSRYSDIPIVKGTTLLKGDQDKIVIGEGLAEQLGVEIGDYLSVLTTTTTGAYNAGSLQIIGFFRTGQSEVDNRLGLVPLSFAQRMLNTDSIERIVIYLEDIKATNEAALSLKEAFASEGLELEIRTWEDLATLYHQVRTMYEAIFIFMVAAISTLVFFSILEVMTMSFFERIREIGTIRAIGTKRVEVFKLFLQEGAIIGATGGVLGIALGWALGKVINLADISYTPPSLSMAVPLWINLDLTNGLAPLLVAFFSVLLSTIYPAFKSTRLEIVEALRYA